MNKVSNLYYDFFTLMYYTFDRFWIILNDWADTNGPYPWRKRSVDLTSELTEVFLRYIYIYLSPGLIMGL